MPSTVARRPCRGHVPPGGKASAGGVPRRAGPGGAGPRLPASWSTRARGRGAAAHGSRGTLPALTGRVPRGLDARLGEDASGRRCTPPWPRRPEDCSTMDGPPTSSWQTLHSILPSPAAPMRPWYHGPRAASARASLAASHAPTGRHELGLCALVPHSPEVHTCLSALISSLLQRT